MSSSLRIEVREGLREIDAGEWDDCAGSNNPFLLHAFLVALEENGCVGSSTTWRPQHLVIYRGDRLVGAVPLYLKFDSYGEYVFDWAWAQAYERAGMQYYPKLVAAIPFTPVSGKRFLVAPGEDFAEIAGLLMDGALQHARQLKVSSLHWLFTSQQDTQLLAHHNHLRRTGYQFHWFNDNYESFDDFLASFSSAKRKKIKRERRHVREAGVSLTIVEGRDVTDELWNRFYAFYRSTIECRGAIPYLNPGFFRQIGRTMADKIVLVLASHEDEYVAGALNLKGDDTLYGRYWGSVGEFNSLHFETCYYRAIEYCIDKCLTRFEAGAQGEHKLSRGFLPNKTWSAHWLRHPEFTRAVSEFLDREHQGIEHHVNVLQSHSPFRQPDKTSGDD
ncbi:MAG: GNAT family N-acetyltransferase [Acidiferrobacterales bacterium]